MADGEDEWTWGTFLACRNAIHKGSASLKAEIREASGLRRKPTAR
jgi:hypothetical protein